MRLRTLLLLTLATSPPTTTSLPTKSPFLIYTSTALEGYAKENPLGETTGGTGGPTVTPDTEAALHTAVQGTDPAIIIIKGPFTLTRRLAVGSNKSLIGHADTAHITGNGIDIADGTNVIVQNIKVSFTPDQDAITIRNSTRVWIDHNEFESDISTGPDFYDGQVDIIRGSDFITVSWNYFHDHYKSSLVGNDATFRDIDFGRLHITYHHNYWRNEGTRGPAGRFGHQHVYNNLYQDFLYQALHSRSDNQMLVEGNVFWGNTREALSTYGLVIPEDSPNTCVCGDEELDGFANLGADNDWGPATINITQVGDFFKVPYQYTLTPLEFVQGAVTLGAGIGKI